MPRPLSWPVRRTPKPSSTKEAYARVSAQPQSSGISPATILRAVGDDLGHARVQLKSVGTSVMRSPSARRRGSSTPVGTALGPVDLRVRAPVDGVLVADHAQRGARLRAPLVQAVAVLLEHRLGVGLA